MGSSIQYVRKIFRKTNISYPLIRTRTCAYQEERNIRFSEKFSVRTIWMIRDVQTYMVTPKANLTLTLH